MPLELRPAGRQLLARSRDRLTCRRELIVESIAIIMAMIWGSLVAIGADAILIIFLLATAGLGKLIGSCFTGPASKWILSQNRETPPTRPSILPETTTLPGFQEAS
jgi:hypothetical protein